MNNKQRSSHPRGAYSGGNLLGAALLALLMACALFANPAQAATYSRGVNLSGMEFNSGTLPGVVFQDFTENSEASYTYYGGKGLTLIRVPFLWERVQPTLNGPLDATYLSYITNNINWAKLHGCKVSLDVHSYGAYRGGGIDAAGSGVTTANLVDLWTKLSTQYKAETGVYSYDIMNEPVNAAAWHTTSQSVVTAIRNNGDNKLIYVPGSVWESAGSYSGDNGPTKWITDPANNMVYSAHMYFDHDNSGTYGWSYDTELSNNANLAQIGVQRFDVFKNWCVSNGVRGYIGEFGIPGNDIRWNTPMQNFFVDLDAAGFDSTYWAGGEWWGTYPLSVQPNNNFNDDQQQMPVLLAHLPNGGVGPLTPTNLVATAGNAQVALTWTASTGSTSYNVKRSTVLGSGWGQLANTASTNYTDTGLVNGTTYYYEVSGKNAISESGNAPFVTALPSGGITSGPVKINTGGIAASPFIADTDFSGGTTATNWTGAIDTTAVTSPAPQAVYQSERWGASTYTIGGLTANASYTVRLHFCENFWTAAGARTFNVAINGVSKLANFDIFATAGAIHKANIQQFTVNANGSGQMIIALTNVVNNGLINGIEVNSAGGPPAAPTGLTATAGNTQVALSWTASSGATSYNVSRSTVSGSGYASVATGIVPTSYTNTGLTNGTAYFFVVSATNGSGTSGNSAQASATPQPGIPAAPTGLGATSGSTQVALTWTAISGATSYNVKRSTVNGSGYASVVTGVAATTYTNTGLTNGTTYYFVVTATNVSGTSGNSNQASAAPSGATPQAQIASGTATIDGTVEAAWSGATSYPLSKTVGTVTSASDCSGTWQAMWDSNNLYFLVNVTDDVKINDSTNVYDDDCVEIFIDGNNDKTTTYDANDRQYQYGWGDATVIEASFRNATGVTFAKVDPTGTTYRIETNIPWTTIGVTPSNNKLIGVDVHIDDDDDGGARDGEMVWNDTTDMAWSNPSLFGTGKLVAPLTAPAAPTGLTATAGDGQVALSWSASSTATSYNVLRSTVSGSGYASVATGIATTSYTNTGLTIGTTYYFVVTATNSAGTSGNSNQASATPAVPQAQIAPGTATIDGTVEAAWNNAAVYPLRKNVGTITNSADCSGTWQGMWDATNLYVLVNVTDDVKKDDSVNVYDDDCVEVFLDADHNGGTVYDANDRHFQFRWNDAVVHEGSQRSTTGVAFAQADPTGTTYRMEIKIPWALVVFTPASGSIIGIDAHIDDDDDGGARDGEVCWNDATDNAWQNPSLFGVGKLN